jgi:hypothetical protein
MAPHGHVQHVSILTSYRCFFPFLAQANAFSAGSVLAMLAVDTALFAALAWYLDKARRPWLGGLTRLGLT